MFNLDSAILYSSDISRIRDFYENKIGFTVEYQDGDSYISFIFPNGARLGVDNSPGVQPGNQTVYIATEAPKTLHDNLVGLGCNIASQYTEYEWGSTFSIFDPDGNKCTFIKR